MGSKVDSIIADFVVALRQAIAQEAAEAFMVAGGGGAGLGGNGRQKPGPKPKGLLNAAQKSGGAGNRRSPEAMEKQSNQILGYIRKHPGQRAEDIGKALGLSTGEMALPIAKMLSEGSLKKKGIKRATTYSAPK